MVNLKGLVSTFWSLTVLLPQSCFSIVLSALLTGIGTMLRWCCSGILGLAFQLTKNTAVHLRVENRKKVKCSCESVSRYDEMLSNIWQIFDIWMDFWNIQWQNLQKRIPRRKLSSALRWFLLHNSLLPGNWEILIYCTALSTKKGK